MTVHEWMHKVKHNFETYRVWAKATTWDNREFIDQKLVLRAVFESSEVTDPLSAIADLPFVNACEVINRDGDGRIIYNDWP